MAGSWQAVDGQKSKRQASSRVGLLASGPTPKCDIWAAALSSAVFCAGFSSLEEIQLQRALLLALRPPTEHRLLWRSPAHPPIAVISSLGFREHVKQGSRALSSSDSSDKPKRIRHRHAQAAVR